MNPCLDEGLSDESPSETLDCFITLLNVQYPSLMVRICDKEDIVV